MWSAPYVSSDEDRGLIYEARAGPKQRMLLVESELVELSPGMLASVKITTGRRHVIEFFLASLLIYKGESIRER